MNFDLRAEVKIWQEQARKNQADRDKFSNELKGMRNQHNNQNKDRGKTREGHDDYYQPKKNDARVPKCSQVSKVLIDRMRQLPYMYGCTVLPSPGIGGPTLQYNLY